MDRLSTSNAAPGKFIIWRHPLSHILTTGTIVYIGDAVVDEWGKIPTWIRWDDLIYVLEYDDALVPQKLNHMASKTAFEILCAVEIYVFDTEQDRLLGLLKLTK
jgi:hypothetical protein